MNEQTVDPGAAVAAAGVGVGMLLFQLAISLLMIVGAWKMFSKAGQPGWAILVPFYNVYVFLKVAGKPGWWMVMMFVPIANIVFAIMATAALAKNFGKGGGFVVGLILLPIVFYPILGFGGAQYRPIAS